jgi:small subunit ribosomal protein S4
MRRIRNKFRNPRTSWDSDELKARGETSREYGLRRRKEILIAQEILRNFRRRARELTAEKDEKKVKALLDRLVKLGLLAQGKGLDDVLALGVNDILGRRLQTIVWKKGFAKTPKQARQLITHGHVAIGGKAVKSPSYMVPTEEEAVMRLVHQVSQSGGEKA